jgi:serine protease Do
MCTYVATRIFPRKYLTAFALLAFLVSPLYVHVCEAFTDLTTAIVDVAKNNIPAVVHIEVTERREVPNPLLPFESNPLFRQFFGSRSLPKKFKQEIKGLGSGIIMDNQGHILTNYHVAGEATKLEVILADGRRYTGTLVGGDPKTDIAVVRIHATGKLSFALFGDSDKLEVGQWVVAIGAPRGLTESVSQGIISAKHRRGITEPTSYEDFLQTDAAINPGNSGGPLLNLKGEVIGVNASIVTESGGFEGIGFAIPSNIALHIGKILISHGKVVRGWLGVSVGDLIPEKAKSVGLPETTKGALVAEVPKGGPADRAGLRKDDIIVGYEGKQIRNSGEVRNMVADTAPGQEVKVTILRSGKRMEIPVRIGNLEESSKVLEIVVKERLGAEVKELTSEQSQTYGLQPGQGVAVSWVDPKGPLGRAGFEVGDLILEINGQKIAGIGSIVEMADRMKPGKQISILGLDHNSRSTGFVQVTTR